MSSWAAIYPVDLVKAKVQRNALADVAYERPWHIFQRLSAGGVPKLYRGLGVSATCVPRLAPSPPLLERFLTFSLSLLVSQAQHLHSRHHVDDPREDAHRHRRAHSSPRRRQDRIDDLAPIPLAAASSSRRRSRIPLLQYLLYNTLPPSISSNISLYTPLARTRIPSLEPLPPPPSPHCIARRTVLSTRPACARARRRLRRLRECACARSCRRRGTRSRGRGRPSARARRR